MTATDAARARRRSCAAIAGCCRAVVARRRRQQVAEDARRSARARQSHDARRRCARARRPDVGAPVTDEIACDKPTNAADAADASPTSRCASAIARSTTRSDILVIVARRRSHRQCSETDLDARAAQADAQPRHVAAGPRLRRWLRVHLRRARELRRHPRPTQPHLGPADVGRRAQGRRRSRPHVRTRAVQPRRRRRRRSARRENPHFEIGDTRDRSCALRAERIVTPWLRVGGGLRG